MKSIKKTIGIVVAVASLLVVAVTFYKVVSSNSTGQVEIRLAHNQSRGSEIADSIAKFSEFAAEDENMNLRVDIYASGVLGTEKEEVEMVKAGILDMAKVSSNTLGQFKDEYSIFAVPYLFTGQQHYYDAMEKSEKVKELFRSTEKDGYIAIGYYANGSRNFYLKEDIACDSPEVLRGKKIRSMPSSTSMHMIELMGGSPVPMAAGETYTSLQQGIVDGAENTELALTVDGHQDLVKSYTYTEHQYSPDIYIISTKKWNSLTEEQQNYLVECLNKTNENFKSLYNGMMEDAITEAKEHGVTVYRDIDKTAFIEAVAPVAEEYCAKGETYQALYDDIQQYSDLAE
jgi:tripartite ATP-independent transporter DctP family solute receptor